MYNDYYLQQILAENIDINNNSEEILLNQKKLISGDILIYNELKNQNTKIEYLLSFLIGFFIVFCAYIIHHIIDYTWKES